MKGSDIYQELMKKEGVEISKDQSIRLANFLSGMISVHGHVREERDELRAKLAAMESQEPFGYVNEKDMNQRFLHSGYMQIENKETDYSKVPVYAKPVPSDKPERITEQDARAIAESILWHESHCNISDAIDAWSESDCQELLEKLNFSKSYNRPSHESEQGEEYHCQYCGSNVCECLTPLDQQTEGE